MLSGGRAQEVGTSGLIPRSVWKALAPIALLGIIAFAGIFRAGFLWDDHEMIVKNPRIQSITVQNLNHIFTHDVFDGKGDAYYRPLQSLLNMVDFALWGLNPAGFHATNLAIHILTAWLLFIFLWRSGVAPPTALGGALLFVVHPIVVEQLLIIAGRAELMAAFFTLAALVLAQRGTRSADFWAAGMCFLAALSKESGVVAPVLTAVAVARLRSRPGGWFFLWGIVGWAIYFPLRAQAVGGSIPALPPTGWGKFLFLEFPTIILNYLRILVFPVDLHSHRRMVFTLSHVLTMTGVFAIGAVLLARSRRGGAWVWVAWAMLALAPKIPLLATNSLMLDHWAYLPAIALCVAVAKTGDKTRWVVPGVLGIFWMALSQWNTAVRNTDEKLYRHALRYPTSSIVRANLGGLYFSQGELPKALPLLVESLRMNPSNVHTAVVLSRTLQGLNQRDQALAVLAPWTSGNKLSADALVVCGSIIGGEEGLRQLDRALAIDSANARAWRVRADLQHDLGDDDGARQSLEEYLRLNPADDHARRNLLNFRNPTQKIRYRSTGIKG